MTSGLTQLRADAHANREKILTAARSLFAERGLEVGMREIARRAQVGAATLYRRFPTRQDLIDEAFGVEMGECGHAVDSAAAAQDAWVGLTDLLRGLLVTNVNNRGFIDAFTATQTTDRITAHRRELLDKVAVLAGEAKGAGQLRADFTMHDFTMLLQVGRTLAAATPARRAQLAQRFATLAIAGLRNPDGPK